MTTVSEALAIALQHHQAGRLQAAEHIYRQILAVEPNHVQALHLLGFIAHQVGHHAIAIEYIGRAIQLHGAEAIFHNNLGLAYRALNRISEAADCYRRALQLKPDLAEAHCNLGIVFQDQGKLQEAVACYSRALQLKPDFAQAHSNLGSALQGQGKLQEAADCYRRALQLTPDFAEAHCNLGFVFQDQGKLQEAVASFRRALQLKPDFAQAHFNLGYVLKAQGKLQEAADCYRRALELMPHNADAHFNLGNVFKAEGKFQDAADCYRLALQLRPDFADAHSNLGNAFQAHGKLEEAAACYRRALELKPDFAEAHCNLGTVFQEQGKLEEAVGCYRLALQLQPDFAEAHNNLGGAFKDLGMLQEAVTCSLKALELNPDYAPAHNNLGNVFNVPGKLEEAVDRYRRALQLQPDFVKAHNNLGTAFQAQGKLADALACFRRALQLKPDYVEAHNNLLLAFQYCQGITAAELAQAHAEFDRQHAASLRGVIPAEGSVRDRHGRPRLGFVSPDLARHPVGYFLVRVLENLALQQHETVCYSNRIIKDDLTHRCQAAVSLWRDVIGMSDEQLADQIRADGIDILFDLAGHTAHNRLLVFARKPAPMQITWIGYEGTTGLTAMDYLLGDRYLVPEEIEGHCREKVLRLPDSYVCYETPWDAPAVAPLPALQSGQLTLGCFNNPAKITTQVVQTWGRILRRLPTARLMLKYKGFNTPTVIDHFTTLFAAEAIDASRLLLSGSSPFVEYLHAYRQIDLALDPFPFSGGVTTCEALWMGVPVVTCPGETFASRHGLSYLSNVGLTETIARNLDEYVEMAVALAANLPRLAAIRAGLRERMAGSPLCDGQRFAKNLMALLSDCVSKLD